MNFKTPFEIKNGYLPNISNIQVFGSLVYYKLKGLQGNTKIGPKAELGILIGYGENSANYKIWELKRRIPIWVRDLKIIENSFLKASNEPTKIPKELNREEYIDLFEAVNSDLKQLKETNNGLLTDNAIKEVNPPSQNNKNNNETIDELATEQHLLNNPVKNRRLIKVANNNSISNLRTIKNNSDSDVDELANILVNITNINKEPSTFKQAITSPEKIEWLKSIKAEIEELERQNT